MSTLLELADRCEREESSSELDGAIAHALAEYDYAWWRERAGGFEFTRSLDAAVTLVPESVEWWEVYVERNWKRGPARAMVDVGKEREWITAFSATTALALCAAALRARAAMEAK